MHLRVGGRGPDGPQLGSGPGWGSHAEPFPVSAERELAKAEKLSLEEGRKDARGLRSGLRRRKRPLSWRAHGDGTPHPDPDPCARTGMHTSGGFCQAWWGAGEELGAWLG